MTKKEVVKLFHKNVSKHTYERWGRVGHMRGRDVLRVDPDLKREAWVTFLNQLIKDNKITSEETKNWSNPF